MKKTLFTLVIIGLSGLIFSGQAMAGKFDQRQVWQQKRIWQGVKNGRLTRYEARNLSQEILLARWPLEPPRTDSFSSLAG
jgi:hypothetical protein